MTTVTLEAVQQRQAELAAMIEALSTVAPVDEPARTIVVNHTTIEIAPGEHYAGAVLDEHGAPRYHLVLLARRPPERLNWKAATSWADLVGGTLPTRQEAALVYANCKPHLEPAWHWTCEAREGDASCAWSCSFLIGIQFYDDKSYEGRAVAVRRV